MQHRDYMMRYFEQLGEVLAALLGFKKKRQVEKADKLIQESFERFLKISPAEFDDIQPSEIIDYVLQNFEFDTHKLTILAELIKEKGELSMLRNNTPMALHDYQMALNLFDFVEHEEKTYALDRIEKKIWLQEQISYLAL